MCYFISVFLHFFSRKHFCPCSSFNLYIKKTEVHFIDNCMISDDKYKSKCNCYLKSNERIYFEFAYFPIVGPNAENYPTAHPSPSLIFSFLKPLPLYISSCCLSLSLSLAVLYLYLYMSLPLCISLSLSLLIMLYFSVSVFIYSHLPISLLNCLSYITFSLLLSHSLFCTFSVAFFNPCIGAHGTPFIPLLFVG